MAIEMVGLGVIAAYLGKDGLAKLLGPTADYLGGELKDFAQRRIENVGKIFANASEKVPHEKQNVGAVPPKVLRSILNEGSYSSECIGIEYFGGILASSKSEINRDDRASRLTQKISSLSTYQLRAHYLLYSSLVAQFKGSGLTLNYDRNKLMMFVTMRSFLHCMDFNRDEFKQIDSIFLHTFSGLEQEGLISKDYAYGSEGFAKGMYPQIKGNGIIFEPTASGADLLLWAFGAGNKECNYIFDIGFSSDIKGIDIAKLEFRPVSEIK
ncbi:hypothetical protein RBA29_002454 [Cronobacter turicensis]|nr:hypothetical protein [Cronobacter turicensis]EKY3211993.1 hypothetical protein [Cronobacter turicensis]